MLKLKDKLTSLLLFTAGILWGNCWISEFLSCPEWWFIAGNTILCGGGIALANFLPDSWKKTAPALPLMLILLLPPGTARMILLPLFFGIWYGGNDQIFRQWQISRIFCGGMVIGGVIPGIIAFDYHWAWNIFSQLGLKFKFFETGEKGLLFFPSFAPVLAVTLLIYSGLQRSWKGFLENLLLTAVVLQMLLPLPAPVPAVIPEPGTVISGFSLIGNTGKTPKIAVIGIPFDEAKICFQELDPVAYIILLPELPGTLPENCDMIVATDLPLSGDRGKAALKRALKPEGILILPAECVSLIPENIWHTLPGSNGKYAVSSPQKKLTLDPRQMDRQLEWHYRKRKEIAPAPGALTGLLCDFESKQLITGTPENNTSLIFPLTTVACILLFLLFIMVKSIRKTGNETGRIIINCAGFAMVAAATLPMIAKLLPNSGGIRSLLTATAILWVFRRPYKRKKDYTWFAGLLALLSLGACFFADNSFAAAALIFSGYAFASLDGELLNSKRDNFAEAIRFPALALGIFLAGVIQYFAMPEYILPAVACALRFWSWLRN